MLSAAVRRTSRDVSVMKEKLIFSGDSLHGPWIRRFTCDTEGQADIASFQALTHALTEGQKHVRQPQIQGLSDRLFEGPTFLLSSHVTSVSDGCVLSPAASPCCSSHDEGSCKDMQNWVSLYLLGEEPRQEVCPELRGVARKVWGADVTGM